MKKRRIRPRTSRSRDFKATIRARAARDHEFREALLRESAESIRGGDFRTARTIFHDYI